MTQPLVRLVADLDADVDVVGIGVVADCLPDLPERDFLATMGFSGMAGETAMLPGNPVRIMVGYGPRDRLDGPVLRRAGAALASVARRSRTVAVIPPDGATGPAEARALVEGFLLGLYRFDRYRTVRDRPGSVERVDVVAPGAGPGVATGQAVAAAVRLARDLGNEPGAALTPPAFAERAAEIAEQSGLDSVMWDERRIEAEGLGGLLGVSRGSAQPPRLVTLTYSPDRPNQTIALVGKGITFDSGGLSIKSNPQMRDMKIDMAGAAAVLGAMSALRSLGCPTRVVGWLPLAENMSGCDAMRLGDVLRTRCGTTVEVRNADAEGRLVLADALALAAEARPDAILDLATLTGAIALAVGRGYAGLAGNDDRWMNRVRAAADRAGELVWPLPMGNTDPGRLRSRIADLVNVPDAKDGQSVAAAQFLREFVPADLPWAHLDIDGPAHTDADDGELVAGATGFGVRTLLELLTGTDVPPDNE